MKQIYRSLTFIALLLLTVCHTYATHIVGGALTYVHNGGSSYTVTLKLYRDCCTSCASFPNSVTVQVNGYGGAAFSPSKNFTLSGGPVVNLPSNLDTCAIPPNPVPCVEERTYTATVNNLPANPGGYHLYYQLCCRNLSTVNVDCACNCIGESFYAYIPGPSMVWKEEFTLSNGTTVDNSLTAWSRTLGSPAPNYASVQSNVFEIAGANNAELTWTSQSVNISSFTSGVNLSAEISENGNFESGDSIMVYYKLNNGPLTLFSNNGLRINDFGSTTATTNNLIGDSLRIYVRAHYDGNSPNSELYRIDNVMIYGNDFAPNSSPVFDAFPPLFLCAGNPFNFNHAATDPDGDSLAYSFYTPYTDQSFTWSDNTAQFLPVLWQPGFSATNPIGGSALSLNGSTGLLSGTPTQIGQFVVGVKVEEYRNGKRLSEMVRDFQFNVIACPPPAQAVITSEGPLNVCDGNDICFPNESDDIANNWWWNFGDPASMADTSNQEFPCYSYAGPGTYTAMLIINKGTTCADTAYATVNVGWATANFNHNAPQCIGAPVNFTDVSTTSSNASINSWLWSFGDLSFSSLQNPTHAYTASGALAARLVITTNIGCIDTIIKPLTIQAQPVSNAGGGQTVCSASPSVNLSGSVTNAGGGIWTGGGSFAPNDTTLNAVYTPSSTEISNGFAALVLSTIGNGACSAATDTMLININPTPAAPTAGNNGPLCVGTTLNLTAVTVSGATYSWTGPNGFSSSQQNPIITNVTTANAGVYSVTATVNGCTGTSGFTNVSIASIPAAPVAGSNGPVCEGQTLNLLASNISGAVYSWTGPNGFTSALQNPTIAAVNSANAGTYNVTATVNGCTGPAGTVSVVVNVAPSAPVVSNNGPICTGATLNLSAGTISGATYSWTGPNGYTSTQQNPGRANSVLSMAGTYSVTATVNGCPGPAGTTDVIINATPAAPSASSNSPVCEGSALNLSAGNVSGAAYSWSGPNGFSSSLQNPSIGGSTISDAGTYLVNATVNGCTGPSAGTITVINVMPLADAGSDISVCANNGDVVLSGSSTTGSGVWTTSGSGTLLPNATTLSATYTPSVADTANGGVTLTLTSTNNGACTASSDQMNITYTPAPVVSVGADQTVCANNAEVSLSANWTVAGGISWSLAGDGFFSPSNIASTVTYTPGSGDVIAGTVSIYATSTGNNNCLAVSDTMTATITPAPTVNAGTDEVVCAGGGDVQLNGSVTGGATTGTWSILNGSGSFTPANTSLNATYVFSSADTAAGTVTLVLTSTGNGNCVAVSDTMAVSIITQPLVVAGADQTVCANNGVIALNGISNTGAGVWSSSGTGTFTPGNNLLNTTYIPSDADTAAGAVTLSLSSVNNGGCTPAVDELEVVITPAPVVDAGADQSTCVNNPNVNLSGTFTVASGASWTSSGTGTFSPGDSSMNTTYIPSTNDLNSGGVTVVLTTYGNGSCVPESDTMLISYTVSPVVSAGVDQTVCANSNVLLNGTSSSGAGVWSTNGSGTFLPNNSQLNATYQPSGADTAAGTVTLTLTSTNNGSCVAVLDSVAINFTAVPVVGAGVDQTVCANNSDVALIGNSTSGSGIWMSSGDGSFLPNDTSLNPTYVPGVNDIDNGGVTLTLTSTQGCTAVSDSMSITITPAPVVAAGQDVVICSDNSNIQLNGTVAGGSNTGIWSTPDGSGNFSPANTTLNATYTFSSADTLAGSVMFILTSTNNGDCFAVSDTMIVSIISQPIALAGLDQIVCANTGLQLNGTIVNGSGSGIWRTVDGTGAFVPADTSLNTAYEFSSADTLAGALTFILTSTNNGNCLAVKDTMEVIITPAPIADAGSDQSVCINNPTVNLSGNFTVATGARWSTAGDGNFSPSDTVMNATYTPGVDDLNNGTVSIALTTTGNGNCNPVSDTMTITFSPAPLVEAGADQNVCLSNPDVVLSGSSSAGSGIWTTSGTGIFSPNNNQLNATYTPGSADTAAGMVVLSLTSTNNGSCLEVADSMVVTFTTVPIVYAGADQTVCANNAEVQVTGSSTSGLGKWLSTGGGTFFPGDTALNATYTPDSNDIANAGAMLILASQNGCTTITDSMYITITPAPVVNAGQDEIVCADKSSVQLNGSISGGTSTGIWSTSDGSGTFTPNDTSLNTTYVFSSADTLAGSVTFVLTSTGNGNCIAVSDTMRVVIIGQPIAQAGADQTVCANTALDLNGNIVNGSGTGIWSSTNGTGFFVPDNTALNGTYEYSAADTLLGALTFILSSTNNGSCLAASDTMEILITPAPVVDAGVDQSVCANNASLALNGDVYGGATSGQWSSSGGGSFIPGDTALSTTYMPDSSDVTNGIVSIVLSSTNNGNCFAKSDTMLLTITPSPVVDAGQDIFVCEGTMDVQLEGVVSGGASSGNWTRSGSGSFSPDSTALNAVYHFSSADTLAGGVILVLTSSNNGGCLPVNDSVEVKITTIPAAVIAGNDTVVCGNTLGVVLNGNIVGGAGTAVWSTLGDGAFSPNSTDWDATYMPSSADVAAGIVSLIFSATNTCLPVDDTVQIGFAPLPVANAGADQTICSGENVLLSGSISIATGAYWSSFGTGTFLPGDTILNATYLPGIADITGGNVDLVLTSTGNGICSAAADTMRITIQEKPAADFTYSDACVNTAMSFTDFSTGAVSSWNWDFGDSTSGLQYPEHTYATSGKQSVSLVVSTSAGCRDTIVEDVFVDPLPIANFELTTACPDSAYFMDASSVTYESIAAWVWSFGDSTTSIIQHPEHQYPGSGKYSATLTVMSASGCAASATKDITIEFCEETQPTTNVNLPVLPSAFTPNKDGINDILEVLGGPFSQLDFVVFNQWGNELFRSKAQSEGWDGTFRGKEQPESKYIWIVKAVTEDGVPYNIQGEVSLIR